jgi:hypothetical protein
MSGEIERVIQTLYDDEVDACLALDEAQEFYNRTAEHMDDGPRATALAALATARFHKVLATSALLQARLARAAR